MGADEAVTAVNYFDMQDEVLSLMIYDDLFINQVASLIKPDYFQLEYHKSICRVILSHHQEHQRSPSPAEIRQRLREDLADRFGGRGNVDAYFEALDKLTPVSATREYVLGHITKFARDRAVQQALDKAIDLREEGRHDEIPQVLDEALRVGLSEHIGYRLPRDFARAALWEEELLLSGITDLDEVTASIARKELGFFMAFSGIGKSTLLLHMAKSAMTQNLRVVYYTLELSEDVVTQRFESMITGIPYKEINERRPEVIHRSKKCLESFGGTLVVKEFPSGVTVRDLERHLNVLWQKESYHPDVLIVDYADLMNPVRSGLKGMYEQQKAVYEEIRGLGQKRNNWVWTASQANRAAYSAETVTGEHTAESIGKHQTADLVITISKSKDKTKKNTLILMVDKNRRGPTEKAVECDIDYSCFRLKRNVIWDADD